MGKKSKKSRSTKQSPSSVTASASASASASAIEQQQKARNAISGGDRQNGEQKMVNGVELCYVNAAFALKGTKWYTTPPAECNGCTHMLMRTEYDDLDDEEFACEFTTWMYWSERIKDEDAGAPTGFTNLQFLRLYGGENNKIGKETAAYALADACNHSLRGDLSEARCFARIHMLFDNWIKAGKPEVPAIGNNKYSFETADGGNKTKFPEWMRKSAHLHSSVETFGEVCKYIQKYLPCDCLQQRLKAEIVRESKNNRMGAQCHHCKSPDATFKCSRCNGGATYCSRDCQVKEWKTHKPICKLLQGKAVSLSVKDNKAIIDEIRETNPLRTENRFIDQVNRMNINNDEGTNTNRPQTTSIKISKDLFQIQDPTQHSRDEVRLSLNNILTAAASGDQQFLKYFQLHDGMEIAFEFLGRTMEDPNCVGKIRIEFIKKATLLFQYVCGESVNKDVALRLSFATSAIDCEGISSLCTASKEYNGGNECSELDCANSVWGAFMSIIGTPNVKFSEEQWWQVLMVFDTGIDIITLLRSIDGTIATETLQNVFITFSHIVENDDMSKEFFKDRNILSKCLDVFKKKNNTWECRTELLMDSAVKFINVCWMRGFFNQGSDYEQLLPFIITCAKKFQTNVNIQVITFVYLRTISDMDNGKNIIDIDRSSAMEVLEALLALDEISEEMKNRVRKIIDWITAS